MSKESSASGSNPFLFSLLENNYCVASCLSSQLASLARGVLPWSEEAAFERQKVKRNSASGAALVATGSRRNGGTDGTQQAP